MGWLSKIFKGSNHRISEGQYNGSRHEKDAVWTNSTSLVCKKPKFNFIPLFSDLILYLIIKKQDEISDTEKEDIDHAIALSLSEEEQKKAKTTGW